MPDLIEQSERVDFVDPAHFRNWEREQRKIQVISAKHHEVLEQAGPQALADFERSTNRRAQGPARPGRIQL